MGTVEQFKKLHAEYQEIVVKKVSLEKQLQDVISAEDKKLEEMRAALEIIKGLKTKGYARNKVKELSNATN